MTVKPLRPVRDDRQSVAGCAPPHDLTAEACVLSALLLDPGAIDRVTDLVRTEDFYADSNRWIFEAATSLHADQRPIDVATVASWLRDRERFQAVGGSAYLVQLADETPAIGHVEAHAKIVAEKARVRRLIAECQRIAAEGYGDVGDVEQWVNDAEAALHRIGEGTRADDTLCSMRDALVSVWQRVATDDVITGLRTGLTDLDYLLGPMKAGQMIVIGALSSVGKSALALNIAAHAAGAQKTGTLMFSAEMSREELAERALFAEAQVDSAKLNNKRRLTEVDFRALSEAARVVGALPVLIDDRPGISVAQIRSRARRVQAQWRNHPTPLGLIVVDYLQLLDGKAAVPKGATRENEVAEIARGLKVLAMECRVPVLVLAQLNSDSEKAGKSERKPRLGDLRESKAIGQNADAVILIHNPAAVERAEEYRNDSAKRFDALPMETVDLILAKRRGGGRTGTVQVGFWPTIVTFANLSVADPEDA